MAVDKLVDSTQLDADLTSVANAIRAKSGGSSQLAFPAGFVSEIGNIPSGGGDPNQNLTGVLGGTVTSYEDDTLTTLATVIPWTLTSFKAHNITSITAKQVCANGSVTSLAFPKVTSYNIRSGLAQCTTLQSIDLSVTALADLALDGDTSLNTIVLRNPSVVPLGGANSLRNTAFKSGGAGGTIYIPESLYNHLGDNTSSDYKHATNWSTYDGYGTITWAKIEGSYYETHYADGTTIPT